MQSVVRQSQAGPHITYRNSAGGVVVNARGEIALVLQQNGSWSLPKGGIEEGEERADAARREIREETGLENVTYVETLGSYTRYAIDDTGAEDKRQLKRITVYLFRTDETDLHPMDPRIREARWVTPADAVELLSSPKDQDFLASVRHRL